MLATPRGIETLKFQGKNELSLASDAFLRENGYSIYVYT